MKVLIIGTVWPEPDSSAAGSRMMALIRLFLEQQWRVTFASASQDSDFMADVESIGIKRQQICLNDDGFDVFLKELNPDIVLFDRFMTEEQYGWRVAENCPNALRILDTEDLHCLRQARQTALKQQKPFENAGLFSETAFREIASIWRCDLSLIISRFEYTLLKDIFNVDEALLHYLPFLLDPIEESVTLDWPDFEAREGFVFIGNFLHEPNWDAVRYLKESIWPLIRQRLPDAVVNVYGAYAGPKVMQLHDPKNGFLLQGRAADAQTVVRQAKVALAPLRFGAGLKGKLAEAMWCGTPSVTTSIGAEGMAEAGEWNGFIRDEPAAFADAAVRLHQDKRIWEASQQKGRELFNASYLKTDHEPPFLRQLTELHTNLKEHRRKNFMGAMLGHHTMASTKYLSRWIIEKNKK